MQLIQKELKKYLKYDPDTGIFTWKTPTNRNIILGSVAGSTHSDGYIVIVLHKKQYKAHRLAFLYMEGYFPENEIDHIDRIRDNNCWDNLRHISRHCNMQNKNIYKNNKSGVTGVYWRKDVNKWSVGIMINKINIYLGNFKGLTKAVYHRYKAEVKYNWGNCNSSSTAYLYLKNKGLI